MTMQILSFLSGKDAEMARRELHILFAYLDSCQSLAHCKTLNGPCIKPITLRKAWYGLIVSKRQYIPER